MTKRILSLSLLLIITFIGSAETNIDSLYQELEKPLTDKERLWIYNKLAGELVYYDTDTTYYFAQKALELAKKTNNTEELADALDNISFYYYYTDQYDSALTYINRAIHKCTKHKIKQQFSACYTKKALILQELARNDSVEYYFELAADWAKNDPNRSKIAAVYNNHANYLEVLNNFEKALIFYFKALEIYREMNDHNREAVVLGNIANIYAARDQNEKALEQFLEALEINKELNNSSGLASTYGNIATLYREMEQYDKSLEYNNLALEINKENNWIGDQAMNYYNIGNTYLFMKEYDNAIEFFGQSTQICKKLGIDVGLVYNYYGVGLAYFRNNKKGLAEEYLNLSLNYAKKYKMSEAILKSYDKLYELHKQKADFKKALEYKEFHQKLNDSLFTLKKEKNIDELQTKYETAKKEHQIKELKQNERIQELRQKLIIQIAVGLFIIAILIILFLRKRQINIRQKLKIEQQENEKNQMIIEANKKELTGKAFCLMKAEDYIKDLKEELNSILDKADENTSDKLKNLLKLLRSDSSNKALWNDFETRFNELNDDFITKLVARYPNLSPAEIKLAAMLRMQLSTKEIAEMSNRSPRTIEYTRSNVRKKMGLSANDNLIQHVLSI